MRYVVLLLVNFPVLGVVFGSDLSVACYLFLLLFFVCCFTVSCVFTLFLSVL